MVSGRASPNNMTTTSGSQNNSSAPTLGNGVNVELDPLLIQTKLVEVSRQCKATENNNVKNVERVEICFW